MMLVLQKEGLEVSALQELNMFAALMGLFAAQNNLRMTQAMLANNPPHHNPPPQTKEEEYKPKHEEKSYKPKHTKEDTMERVSM